MPSVAIFGGGVGGLTTTHELAERGFDVEVFDVRPDLWGGKARSHNKIGSGTCGRADLPGEHGFRFFPGFYKHLPDTMRRIPFTGNANGVLDNLVPTTEYALCQQNGNPYIFPVNFPTTIDEWRNAMKALFADHFGIGDDNLNFFVHQLLHLACSCQPRLDYEYDCVAWWDFVDAAKRGEAYQKVLAQGLTRSLVAVQAKESSTRTVGSMLLQLLYNMFTPGVQSDRVLNGPTNDQFIDPWTNYLAGRGVTTNLSSQVLSFNMEGSRIGSVTVNVKDMERKVTADFYVSAIPVEKMKPLLTAEMVAAAPDLAKIQPLKTDWMNGIQFYLNTDVPVCHGHVIYLDSKWAITSISQHNFWDHVDLSKYGNGKVKGILSVDISDWHCRGDQVVFKAAVDCSADEIMAESWAQIKAHLRELIQDSYLVDWFLDPDIIWGHLLETSTFNQEPLLINTVGSLQYRPPAATQIPNLMLAADYVNTYTNLACMEGANEAGRRAANAILDASGFDGSRSGLWPLKAPPIFKVAQDLDLIRWKLTHGKSDWQPVVTS
jgi:uncharacterized protein with NAD-binding domain and iron-sulfur cluster